MFTGLWDYQISIWGIIKLLICYLAIKFAIFVYKNFIRKRLNLVERYGNDSWALVTGATDGIGKALCHDLARSGFNIILVSRTLSKLQAVADELGKAYNVRTHYVQFDFNALTSVADYTKHFEHLRQTYDISILVNNVGSDHHDSFKNVTIDEISMEININVIPIAMLTKIFFDHMDKRGKRSAIISLSSFAGEFPFPMKAIYSATKAFDHFITIALKEEYNNSNVDFLSVKPLEVATPMTGTQPDGVFILTPQQVASSILNDLGHEQETYTHWAHKIQANIVLQIPRFIVNEFMRRFWYALVMQHSSLKKTN
jgi:17beta-estradiol 17-dehydrogenase / very-long-chain 3-oxoacyl-CoA reductase